MPAVFRDELKTWAGKKVLVCLDRQHAVSGTLTDVLDDYIKLEVTDFTDTNTVFIRLDRIEYIYEKHERTEKGGVF